MNLLIRFLILSGALFYNVVGQAHSVKKRADDDSPENASIFRRHVYAKGNRLADFETKVLEQLSQFSIQLKNQQAQFNSALSDLKTEVNAKLVEMGKGLTDNKKVMNDLARPKVSQYTWSALNNDNDSGATHFATYQKKSDSTGLRVSWSGTLGMAIHRENWNGCVRWYFTFNGHPCKKPTDIDMTMYMQSDSTVSHPLPIHRAASVDGVCEGIKAGEVRLHLNVGQCNYYHQTARGDAMTGWNSPSRLLVEEVDIL